MGRKKKEVDKGIRKFSNLVSIPVKNGFSFEITVLGVTNNDDIVGIYDKRATAKFGFDAIPIIHRFKKEGGKFSSLLYYDSINGIQPKDDECFIIGFK